MQTKLPKVGTTIFTTMSQMANEYQAINLSQGFPNFPIDPLIEELLAKNSKENVHQYTPMAGLPALLEGIAALVSRVYQRNIHPATEILVTAGATQGIFAALQALVHPGEEVVILDPAYDCYDPAVHLAGGKPVHISMREDFTIDWKEVRETVNQKTRILIINNPHNPSGKMMEESDFNSLVQVMGDHPNLILISDEVYEFITFEKKHFSAHNHEILRNRSIIVSSFGKTFHLTGWKVGYLIAPEYILKEIKKVHQYLVFSVNSVAQKTLADYISTTDVTTLGTFYQDKRDRFKELMAKSKFELLPSEGTYFQTARYKAISQLSDVQFCEWMVKEVGVAAIPLSVFYEDSTDYRTIRFCFAKTDETLVQAAERLCRI
ncbi:methionine aminotransferase [Fluviicola taffensis]|uniref:2-keto-4-methylthiobutyrate aminotransferase apoenzyme n=1 Tax=Fluviicola taffensis (strain DSM 16823 / NCIMB 13979 / RW262) TaxID=755732 RepID=F2IFZ0_FLUTR|nr:methionine aminotransferase [Fluviicola taffensis]AEA43611.1 2-keto-4-methylthiobutyrate aminotransferase apoenzyme [Fluviicola taffensis DSM 16823]